MRTAMVVVLASVAAIAFSQVPLYDSAQKLRLIYERKSVGGTIVVREQWDQPPVVRVLETTFGANGLVSRRVLRVTRQSGTITTEATIDPLGAQVVTTTSGGASRSTQIPLMKQASVVDPSLTWFSSVQPPVGTTATFMSFDPERRYWEEVKVTFTGRGRLGKSEEGNLVTRQTASRTVRLLLDDKGIPLVWEEGKLRLARKTE